MPGQIAARVRNRDWKIGVGAGIPAGSCGIALVMVLALVALLGALGLMLAWTVQVGFKTRPDTVKLVQARYIAEAGLQWALANLNSNPDWEGGQGQVGNGGFVATVHIPSEYTPVYWPDLPRWRLYEVTREVITIESRVDEAKCTLTARVSGIRYWPQEWLFFIPKGGWSSRSFAVLTWSFQFSGGG